MRRGNVLFKGPFKHFDNRFYYRELHTLMYLKPEKVPITGGASPYRIGHTAISRKVVGKSARDNPERYCGWFWARCSSKKFERMPREAMDVYLRVLKESNKRSFDSYSVWNSVLIISHITFRDRRLHIFADNLSRNSCIWSAPQLLFVCLSPRYKY